MSDSSGWLDERVDLRGVKRGLLDREVPERLTWWHTLGSAALTAFVVQVVTGTVLATYYSPAPDHAYDSIRYIESTVTLGSLLRGMHFWGASAMVVLVFAHMVRVFAMGAYKYPREPNWVLGVLMFFLVLAFGFTGYLLPWDQKAYFATQVGTSIAGTAPWIGAAMATLLRGGTELGAATLTRFYAVHVLWLPLLLGLLIFLHLAIVIRQGIAPRPRALEEDAPRRTTDRAYGGYYRAAYAATKRAGVRFWPDIVAKDLIVSCLLVVTIFLLALAAGAPLEAPADPTDESYVPRPEWYFLPFFQLLTLVPGELESTVAVGVPLMIVVVLFALPFFDRGSRRNLLHRPFALAALVIVLLSSGLLIGAAVRGAPPEEAPEVGRPLTSAERAGRALFERQCASCHFVEGLEVDAAAEEEEEELEGPELTDIGLRHSAAWLHSFIETPQRFHPDSDMPGFGPPVLSHQEIEEVSLYLTTLRGPPGSELEPTIADTFPELEELEPEAAGGGEGDEQEGTGDAGEAGGPPPQEGTGDSREG